MFVTGTSQNIFGVKTTNSTTSSQSLTGASEAATANLSTLARFSTLGDLLPNNIEDLVTLSHSKFLTPFDNRRFNRIGTSVERTTIVNGLTTYMNNVVNDDTLVTFLDCIIKATNAAYNMKDLEGTFINYKKTTQDTINTLQNQVNALLGSTEVKQGDATGTGTASFAVDLGEYLSTYIYVYGYHPDDETWITEARSNIINDIMARIASGEITLDDVLPELYVNT